MIFTEFLHATSNKISPIWPLTTLNIVLCVVYAATVIASLMYLPDASLAYDTKYSPKMDSSCFFYISP